MRSTSPSKREERLFESTKKPFTLALARPSTRMSAAIAAAEIREDIDPDVKDASELMTQAVELLPETISLDLESSDQMHLMRKYYKFTSYATALALDAGCSADQALRLLEIGRGLILSHILDSRREISDLHDQHPALANRFTRARDILYNSSHGSRLDLEANDDVFGVRRKRAAAEYMEALTEIRSLQGFTDFLQPQESTQFVKHEITWPVVVVNIHRRRSDALIVTQTGITNLHLSSVKIDDVVPNDSLIRSCSGFARER